MSYFYGADASRWITGVPRYSRVRYPDLYPGVDLFVYWKDEHLEYDLVVQPGADPKVVRFGFDGATKVRLSDEGDLVVVSSEVDVRQQRPSIYQADDGELVPIAGHYQLRDGHEVGFEIGEYDRRKPLTIDPVLIYSTYLGGSSTDRAQVIGVDSHGNVIVGGISNSPNFPFMNEATPSGGFVVKIDPTRQGKDSFRGGVVLRGAQMSALHVAGNDEIYITGLAGSDFPVTEHALDRVCGAGLGTCSPNSEDVFLSVLASPPDAEPQLLYSTFIGGSGTETGPLMHVEENGTVYLAAVTDSPEIPMANSYDESCGTNGLCNAFEIDSIAASNRKTFTDVVLLKLDPRLRGRQGLLYSTYLGGGRDELLTSMVAGDSGIVYLAGTTYSTDFPITAGPFIGNRTLGENPPFAQVFDDSFVVKLDSTVAGPAGLRYASIIGGSTFDDVADMAIDAGGGVYLGGSTRSRDFPLKHAADSTPASMNASSEEDGFLAYFDPSKAGDESLVYSTYLGGSRSDRVTHLVASDRATVFIAGFAGSRDFPVAPNFTGQKEPGDLFVLEVDPNKRGVESYLSSVFLGRAVASSFSRAEDGSLLLSGVTISDRFLVPSGLPDSQTDVFYVRLRHSSIKPSELQLIGGRIGVENFENLRFDGDVKWLANTVLAAGGTRLGNFRTTPSALQTDNPNELREAGFLSVVAEEGAGSVAVFPPTVEITTELGEPPPSNRRILVAPMGEPVGFSASVQGGSWLSIDVPGGTAPGVIEVHADTAGLQPGEHAGQVEISTNPESQKAKVIPVRLVLGEGLPAPNIAGVVNGATLRYGAVSPGEIVSLFGVRMGPQSGVLLQLESGGKVAADLHGVRVLFDNVAAPMIFGQANQLSAVVPYSVARKESVEMVTEYQGMRSAPISLKVTDASPGIFTLNASGSGPGAVLNQDLSINSPTNPAQRGSVIVLFATGEGETDPPGRDGVLAGEVLPRPKLPVLVRVDGIACEVLYAGAAPGLVAGVLQVNARLNHAIPPGDSLSVEIYIGDKVSRRDVTIALDWPPPN